MVTNLSAATAQHVCSAAAALSFRGLTRLMKDVIESSASFPLQLDHAHLTSLLLPLLSLTNRTTDTNSTTVLDSHVFSPLHEFGASCPLPKTTIRNIIN